MKMPKYPRLTSMRDRDGEMSYFPDEISLEYGKEMSSRQYHTHLKNRFNRMIKAGKGYLTIKRTVPLSKRARPRIAKVGEHWSEKALETSGTGSISKYAKRAIITAKVHHSDIDWDRTFNYRHGFPHEREFTLKRGATPKIVDVKYVKWGEPLDESLMSFIEYIEQRGA